MTDGRAGDNTSIDALSAALRLTASMAEQQDTGGLLRAGLALCVEVLFCERAMIIGQTSESGYQVLEQGGDLGDRTPYSTTALRMVEEKRQPLLISDTIEDEVLGVQASIAQHNIRSVLCAGLDTGDASPSESRAYLYLDSRTDRRPFSLEDLEKFRLLSRLMASLVRKSELLVEQEATIEELRGQISEKRFEDLVFGSDSFERCLNLVKQGAPTDVPVLLLGETGTGKELLARVVHTLSRRKDGPFLAVNCGAIPPNLVESQLFGHEKGAFTGALSARQGFFEEASGGTLFLDEIGELPLEVQTRFLRALQEGEIMRVGSAKTIKVDVRIVAATNVDLEQAAAEGRFRKDLFYRLSVLMVQIPPLRERGEDALLLARYFLRQFARDLGARDMKLSREAEKAVLVYDWPGNIRELQNKIQRAVITASGPMIRAGDLGLQDPEPATSPTLREAREQLDREMIASALERSPGNLTNAAKILGIDRKSLRILLEKYGIEAR